MNQILTIRNMIKSLFDYIFSEEFLEVILLILFSIIMIIVLVLPYVMNLLLLYTCFKKGSKPFKEKWAVVIASISGFLFSLIPVIIGMDKLDGSLLNKVFLLSVSNFCYYISIYIIFAILINMCSFLKEKYIENKN